jgi:hypothetical protein
LEFIADYSIGKNVLHLGCVDAGFTQQKYNKGLLLHDRLYRVANTLWGVDIDEAGLNWMRAQGYPSLYQADIVNLTSIPGVLNQNFDLILLTEVLEHLNNPGSFLENIRPLFRTQTEIMITVPNCISLTNFMKYWRGEELVHPDHNFWFSFPTLLHLLTKYGYAIQSFCLYSQYNYKRPIIRHLINKIKHLCYKDKESLLKQAPPEIQIINNYAGSKRKSPRLFKWLEVTFTTLFYRVVLSKNPFFADGLIIIAKPTKMSATLHA